MTKPIHDLWYLPLLRQVGVALHEEDTVITQVVWNLLKPYWQKGDFIKDPPFWLAGQCFAIVVNDSPSWSGSFQIAEMALDPLVEYEWNGRCVLPSQRQMDLLEEIMEQSFTLLRGEDEDLEPVGLLYSEIAEILKGRWNTAASSFFNWPTQFEVIHVADTLAEFPLAGLRLGTIKHQLYETIRKQGA